MKFTRITAHPAVCTGKPCIRDLRFPVSRLLGLLAARQTPEQILAACPYLEAADIDEALRYAASLAEDETVEARGLRFLGLFPLAVPAWGGWERAERVAAPELLHHDEVGVDEDAHPPLTFMSSSSTLILALSGAPPGLLPRAPRVRTSCGSSITTRGWRADRPRPPAARGCR